jgi:hypothetical protein
VRTALSGLRPRRGSVLAALALAASLAGCGSSSTSGTSKTITSTYPPLRTPAPPPHHHRQRAGPRIGQTQHADTSGTTLSVTITRVIDPLRDSGASLPPGTRAIGVEAVVANDGPGGYDSSSTGDFSAVASTGAARPLFAAAGVCATPLRDWDNEISPGETRNGCVAFSLPAKAHVLEVRFSPHALADGRVIWVP